jgi:hypothetical protein
MGSAADRVSYEASRYGQGLLTYALLAGMRGEALDDGGRLDVRKWFDTAQSRVPELARGIGGIQQPLVSSPKGQTFPIALLTPATRGDIPLPLLKPQLLRATCLDENDDDRIGLCAPVRAALRTISSPVSRGAAREEPPLVYVDQVAGEVADAWLPQVRYWIEPAGVRIRLRLRKDGAAANTPLLESTVTVASRDPVELAGRVVEEFVKLLPVAKRP